jgi:hypothetical protein
MTRARDIASATTPNANAALLATFPHKNLIINGAMQVWQRGVSQTVAGYGSVDRFQMSNSTSTFTTTRQAFTAGQTDVPNNPLYYLRCVVSSGGAAGNYMFMSQGIEGVQTGAGQTVTLSFYAKASSALKVGISYQQLFGTSGSSTVSTNGVAVTLSTSWTRYTVTTTLPSIASKTIGTASDMLRLLLWLDSGSTYNTSSGSIGNQSGTFEFSNIQLELGDTATPFEHRSFGDELARCQRYFQFVSQYFEYSIGATGGFGTPRVSFTTPMRANPTYTVTASGGAGAVSLNGFSTKNVSGFPIGYGLSFSSTSSGYIYFDATASADAEL